MVTEVGQSSSDGIPCARLRRSIAPWSTDMSEMRYDDGCNLAIVIDWWDLGGTAPGKWRLLGSREQDGMFRRRDFIVGHAIARVLRV